MKLEYLADSERIKITPETNHELRGIKNWFDRYVDGYMFDPAFKNKLWNGKKSLYDKESNTIPMGLWKEAFKCCEEFGYTFDFVNKNEFPINRTVKKESFNTFIDNWFKDYKFQPREYQLRVALNILKNRYCNIAVATSGGKTLIYAMTMFYLLKNNPKAKFLLIVPSKTLVTQFYNDILEFNHKTELNINIKEIFDVTEKPRTTFPDKDSNIYIGTFQSLVELENYPKEWYKQFYSVVTDEAHKSKSSSYRKILKRTIGSAYYRWGMSGTFPDESTYEMMEIMAKTGPIVDSVKAKELMDLGFISKVKIKGILMNHNNWEFAQALEVVASRDKKAAYDLECEKIQESTERLGVINKIVSQCKANTLVLFHNTEYGQRILEYLKERNPDKDFYYIDGSVKNNGNSKNIENNRTFIKAEMNKTDGRVKILVASFMTLSTGVSIDAINNVIFTQSFKKAQIIIQSIGRALRLHKDKKMAYIFDLVDIFNHDDFSTRTKSKFKNVLFGHWIKRTILYETEQYPMDSMEINLKSGND